MIKIDDINKIIKLVVITGCLKNVKPVSLLLVASHGTGKTELIKSIKCNTVEYVTDLTYFGVLNLLKENEKIKHIAIPDFLKITMKRKSTSDNLISIFNALTDEGISKIGMFNYKADFKYRNCGLITATTRKSFSQKKRFWESIGFVSRMIVVSYSYNQNTIKEIKEYINKENFKEIKTIIKNRKNVVIHSTKELNERFNIFIDNSFRRLKQFQTLAKSNALLNNRDEVIQEDIDEIIRLSQYMNEDYKEL